MNTTWPRSCVGTSHECAARGLSELVLPLIDKARCLLEAGESLQPFAFVGSPATGEMLPVLIDTKTAESKDRSAQLVKLTAEQTQADFIFTVMEAWGLPHDKMPRYQKIYNTVL